MSIPKVQPLLLPVLRAIADGKEHGVREIRDRVAKDLGITAKEQNEVHSGGRQKIYVNHVAFALGHFNVGKAIIKIAVGKYQITECGRKLLARAGIGITIQEARNA